MTAVQFDKDAGRVRLSLPAFEALAGFAGGVNDATEAGELESLHAQGVVEGSRVHPALLDGLEAVKRPMCRLNTSVVRPDGQPKVGDGWVTTTTAALLLDLPDGNKDFFTVLPEYLPAIVARVVRLGPRPRAAADPVPIPTGLAQQLFSAHSADRQEILKVLQAAISGAHLRSAWRAQLAWLDSEEGLTGHTVQVVDSSAGLFVVADDGDSAHCWPTTPTVVWRMLIKLLPDNEPVG